MQVHISVINTMAHVNSCFILRSCNGEPMMLFVHCLYWLLSPNHKRIASSVEPPIFYVAKYYAMIRYGSKWIKGFNLEINCVCIDHEDSVNPVKNETHSFSMLPNKIKLSSANHFNSYVFEKFLFGKISVNTIRR